MRLRSQGLECETFAFVQRAGLGQQHILLPQPTSRPSSSDSNMSSSTNSTLDMLVGSVSAVGQQVACYAATRRGAFGGVTTISLPELAASRWGSIFLPGDVGITGVQPTTPLTEHGDCGAVWVDEDRMAVCMHHGLMVYSETRAPEIVTNCESFGVPMQRIVDAHISLGGGLGGQGTSDQIVRAYAQSAEMHEMHVAAVYDMGHTEVVVREAGERRLTSYGSYQMGSAEVTIRHV